MGITFVALTMSLDGFIAGPDDGMEHPLGVGEDVSVGAASVVQQVLASGRLDEIEVAIAPLLLGAGVRLFDHLGGPVRLEQAWAVASEGVTHVRSRVLA